VNGPAASSVRLLPVCGLLLAMISIQSGAALAKSLFPLLGPAGATTLRLVLATVLLVPAFRAWRGLGRRLRSAPLLAFGCALGFMNLLFYLALQRIPLGPAVAIEFLGPLGVAIASSRRPVDLWWAGLAAAGVVLLAWPDTGELTGLDPVGLLYAAGAGACWAAYIVFGSRSSHLHGGGSVAVGMGVAAAVVVPFGGSSAGASLLDPALLPVGLAVALLSSALPYSIELFAMAGMPLSTFGILMSMEPAIAALSGLLLLGETLDARQIVAIVCVVAASAGSSWWTAAGKTRAG
jgi:inner membrane transporter RhtA